MLSCLGGRRKVHREVAWDLVYWGLCGSVVNDQYLIWVLVMDAD